MWTPKQLNINLFAVTILWYNLIIGSLEDDDCNDGKISQYVNFAQA